MARTDRLSKDQRSKTMRAVKSVNTNIEKALRLALWKKGHRYRKNYSKIIGRPDIVFVSLKIAIFCDSEFWHGYDWDKAKYNIKSNRHFWWPKIEGNIERDLKVTEALQEEGWTVIRFWGNHICNELEKCVTIIENAIRARQHERAEQ